ncbi:MAG: MarC family protein [Alkalilacustris sp.]
MDWGFVIAAFVTLFVVVDPIGLAPIFVALTQGVGSAVRRGIALRACLVSVVLLAAFGLLGEEILGAIGISMPAFQIAGGLLLFLTALDMLFERRTRRREDKASGGDPGFDPGADPSVFPLAMPLIAGPGAMASMILLTGQTRGDPLGVAVVLGVMVAVVALVFVMFLAAGVIERGLGRLGTVVVTRLLGMLLAALSVQFVLDGLRAVGVVG